jgi:hypothetical protein
MIPSKQKLYGMLVAVGAPFTVGALLFTAHAVPRDRTADVLAGVEWGGPSCYDRKGVGFRTDGTIIGVPARYNLPGTNRTRWLGPTEQCRLALLEDAVGAQEILRAASGTEPEDYELQMPRFRCSAVIMLVRPGHAPYTTLSACGTVVVVAPDVIRDPEGNVLIRSEMRVGHRDTEGGKAYPTTWTHQYAGDAVDVFLSSEIVQRMSTPDDLR